MTKSIFVPKVSTEARTRIRHYLNFVSESGVKRRRYYIDQNGGIVEYDYNDFIRNKRDVTDARQRYFFFKDHEYLLQQGNLFVDFDHSRDYLQVQIWIVNAGYMTMAFRVLQRLADKLNRPEAEVMFVEKFSRNLPVGDVKIMPVRDLKYLSSRVSWL